MRDKSQPLIESVKRALSRNREAAPGRILLCCVSGGADSTALFHALLRLSPVMGFCLEAIHVNHGIRGEEANADESFVKKICEETGTPLHIRRLNFRKGEKASEDALRQKRLEAILECSKKIGASAAILGHHREDLVETFLMRLLKGSGIKGLSGFREYSLFKGFPLLRPMKNIPKSDILLFLRQNRIQWREDMSNRDVSYLRNKLRHDLIPLLEREFNPAVKKTLAQCADHFGGAYDYIQSEISRILRRKRKKARLGNLYGEWLYLKDVASFPDLLATELFREWIWNILQGKASTGAREIDSLYKLVHEEQSGTLLRLCGGLIAYRDYERIMFIRASLPRLISKEKIIEELTPLLLKIQNKTLNHPYFTNTASGLRITKRDISQKGKSKSFFCGNLIFRLRVVRHRRKDMPFQWAIPLPETSFPLEIRSRKQGDAVNEKGMTKPLKKWLEEKRIPAPLRDHIAILWEAKGAILRAGTLAPDAIENPLPPFLIIEWEANK
ncbi:tRNA lysidine(34) synthetase TilS [Candidatus Sumerlaeota bacterium]|nr:tRNA lysidine(34) synthetase TilS [Candidatus Sumerlaeota bacterium]